MIEVPLSDIRIFTVPELAALLKVARMKVLRWIQAGDLKAFNAATRAVGRPQWRVTADALEDFQIKRGNAPAVSPAIKRPRRQGRPEMKRFV